MDVEGIVEAVLMWAVPAAIGALGAAVARLSRRMGAMQDGTRTILRSRLVDLHERYVVTGGGCPDWVKQEATQVYCAYHGLGGNGTGTHYYQEIVDAPVKGEKEEAA